jgi:pimeloyl-ACP methyl ester carboxylesterase
MTTTTVADIDIDIDIQPKQMFKGTHYSLSSLYHHDDEPIVVCVHGIGSNLFHYESLTSVLISKGFTVLSYDLIGRGHSKLLTDINDDIVVDGTNNNKTDNYESAYTANSHIKQLKELITFLFYNNDNNNNNNGKKYHLIGHSMGGILAALYANSYPLEILSLTLLAPAGLMDLTIIKYIRSISCIHSMVYNYLHGNDKNYLENELKTAAPGVETTAVHKSYRIKQTIPTTFDAFFQCILHFPLYDCNEQINQLASKHQHIKTFIIWGDNDKTIPLDPSFHRWTTIYETYHHPHLTTKIFPNGRHAFFLQFSDEFNQIYCDYLQINFASTA